MLRTICLLTSFFLIFSSLECFSQFSKKKKIPLSPDTNFIVSYPQFITLTTYTAIPLMEVTITPTDKNLNKYKSDFRGNFSNLLGFSFAYKSVSLHYAFNMPVGPQIDNSKGKSSNTGLMFKINKPQLILNAGYISYDGYYDNNASNYAPSEIRYFVRPDLHYKNVGLNGIYNFSWKKYSYNAPLVFTERQLTSRLGFLIKGGANYTTLYSSDTTILSRIQTNELTAFNNISSIHALLFKAGPGAGLTIVFFKRFYIAFNYFIMANFIEYSNAGEQGMNSRWKSNTNLYTENVTAFGYNSKRLFAGISFSGDINIMRIQGANIETNFATVSVTLGYRFNTPIFLQELWQKTFTRYLKM
jgi:hypothetical protein